MKISVPFFEGLVTISVLHVGGPEKHPVHSVTWSLQSESRRQRLARASLVSYLEKRELGLFKTYKV